MNLLFIFGREKWIDPNQFLKIILAGTTINHREMLSS
tara:strand:- start:973 stop:1083 length:111 start_codon:yes stop_codon:yes gene_type:complete